MHKDKKTSGFNQNEVDLNTFISLILGNKKFILFITLPFIFLVTIYSLLIPNQYTATALLAPTFEKKDLSSQLGSYSVLTGAAGFSLPGESSIPSEEAVARIKSLEFFSKHFLPFIKLENMMAVESWSHESNEIIYNKKIFDINSQKWLNGSRFSKNNIPSKQEAFRVYSKILSISKDSKTGFVQISITHHSPELAREWVSLILKNINDSMRDESKTTSTSSINFLNDQLTKTSLKELKQAISKLLEAQVQDLMIASASKNYVFKILDPPSVPEIKSYPERLKIIILGSFFGFFLSVCLLLIYKKD